MEENKVIKKCDERGNVIYSKDSNGNEEWYDERGNIIYYKNSNGYETWKEYDEKGNLIHFKNFEGVEWWNEYDEKGNIIHSKNSNGYETWKEYDERGNCIYTKDSNGYKFWWEYDERGNCIYTKDSNGYEIWRDYDERGNVIYSKDSDGHEWRDSEYPDSINQKEMLPSKTTKILNPTIWRVRSYANIGFESELEKYVRYPVQVERYAKSLGFSMYDEIPNSTSNTIIFKRKQKNELLTSMIIATCVEVE